MDNLERSKYQRLSVTASFAYRQLLKSVTVNRNLSFLRRVWEPNVHHWELNFNWNEIYRGRD